jgi:hypothetical protein
MCLQVDMSREQRMSQACADFWTPRDRTPVVWQVVGSDETTQDSQETPGSEDYYILTPAPNVLLPNSLHDISPGEYAEHMDDRWRTHGVVHREKKKLQSSNYYFFLFCVRVRYGCIGALGFE